jgi:hypothetical protein
MVAVLFWRVCMKTRYLFILCLLILLSGGSCMVIKPAEVGDQVSTPEIEILETQEEPLKAYVSMSYVPAAPFEELVHKSDLILIGTIEQQLEISFNTVRDNRDPSIPSSELYAESVIYLVRVEEVLKGERLDTIHLIQSGDIRPLDVDPSVEIVYLDKFTPKRVGSRYVLFLRKVDPEEYPESPLKELYGCNMSGGPCHYLLDNGMAKLESERFRIQMGDQYSDRSKDDLREKILSLVQENAP